MDYEWTRIVILVLSMVALVQFGIFYKTKHNLLAIIPASWVINIVLYEVFKIIVDGDPKHYNLSVAWVALILVQGLSLLIWTMYIYKDYTYSNKLPSLLKPRDSRRIERENEQNKTPEGDT